MSKRDNMYKAIEDHGNKLNVIFNTGIEPVKLCKQLRRLEVKANRIACDYCNGAIDSDIWEVESEKILLRVQQILKPDIDWQGRGIIVNGDPRGYTLKIDCRDSKDLDIRKDWGGYGIIAPDLRD